MLARSLCLTRGGAAVRLPLQGPRRRPFTRAFSTGNKRTTSSDDENDPHWSGVDPYYLSKRGIGIAGRVLSRMSDFFRWYEARAFSPRTTDEARSAMFVLTQFPRSTRVDLLEFRDACEQLVHALYEHMYADRGSASAYFADVTADAATAARLGDKATRQAAQFAAGGRRVRLEQLSVNRVVIAAVDYTSVALAPNERKHRSEREHEWLEIQVYFDVTEHLLLASDGAAAGLDDRQSVHTTFTWTFEANVTQPEAVEWWIAGATPFVEMSALLTAAKASESDE